ncbi:rhomboid family intramembrane serine protease [Kiritimatiellota bacterium B12222]|nr:rhomboid family intramembrane serine protease [Kiritimatiellota bacterium B12222]
MGQHGDTITILLLAIIGFTTYQGLHQPAIIDKYLFSTEGIRFRKQWFRLISPAFLHANWGHFAGNAITFFFFGSAIEDHFGSGLLLGLFFGSVAGGSLLCMLLHKTGDYRALGASGGVLGILFSAIILFPGMHIQIFPIPIGIPGWFYAVGYLAYTLFSMTGGSSVSHEGHLGGMLSGILLTLIQNYRLFNAQPILITALLVFSGAGIWYFHANPGRVPGFMGFQVRNKMDAVKAARQQRNESNLDSLLDKVSKEGLQSLTNRERQMLQDASRKRGGRR